MPIMRSRRHRSRAALEFVAGAAVAGLGWASTAWACSPAVSFVPQAVLVQPEGGPAQTEVKLVAIYNAPDEGWPTDATTIVQIRDDLGRVLGEAAASAANATVEATAFTTLPGWGNYDTYYFFSRVVFVKDGVATERAGSLSQASHKLTPRPLDEAADGDGPAATGQPDGDHAPTGGGAGATPAGDGAPGNRTGGTGPKATADGQVPASRPRPVAPASSPAAALAGPSSPSLAVGESSPTPTVVDVQPLADGDTSLLLPDTAGLWSGVAGAKRAPSLLDPADDPAGGVPTGAVLLGAGALALAGVGAVAGERRLALARRSRH